MDAKDMREAIRQFVCDCFYVPVDCELADDASLLDSAIVDSTGILEVTAFLESTFGIAITDAEIIPENLESIERIVAFVERKRQLTRRPTGAPVHSEALA